VTEAMRALLAEYGGNAMKLYRATGILLPIAGGATRTANDNEGYGDTGDILLKTLDGADINELWGEFSATLDVINQFRDPLVQRLTFSVGSPFERVAQAVEADFEEADEYGQPVGVRAEVPYWTMGYDLGYFDSGVRYTWRFLARSTADQIRATHNAVLDADKRLIYRTVMTQLFSNVNKSATLEDTGTVVNVYPFYNGDVTTLPAVPPTWKSYTHTNTHTHYLASGGATVVSGDLDDMELHIYHHGYQEGADLVLFVNRQEFNTIRTFRMADNDSYDFIPAAGDFAATFLGSLVGRLPGAAPSGGLSTYPGYRGSYGPWSIIQEDMIPAGYMVGLASGGENAQRNPIGLREHENAALRGLKLIPQFERYPLREAFYHHAIGAGVRHRGAGVVMQVTAGSYAVPSLIYGGPGDLMIGR